MRWDACIGTAQHAHFQHRQLCGMAHVAASEMQCANIKSHDCLRFYQTPTLLPPTAHCCLPQWHIGTVPAPHAEAARHKAARNTSLRLTLPTATMSLDVPHNTLRRHAMVRSSTVAHSPGCAVLCVMLASHQATPSYHPPSCALISLSWHHSGWT